MPAPYLAIPPYSEITPENVVVALFAPKLNKPPRTEDVPPVLTRPAPARDKTV